MITARIARMLRELQSEPMTLWFCELFRVLEPRVTAARTKPPVDVEGDGASLLRTQ